MVQYFRINFLVILRYIAITRCFLSGHSTEEFDHFSIHHTISFKYFEHVLLIVSWNLATIWNSLNSQRTAWISHSNIHNLLNRLVVFPVSYLSHYFKITTSYLRAIELFLSNFYNICHYQRWSTSIVEK